MRFLALHKTASYLMVLTSLLALVAPGELNPVVSVLALAGTALSWLWEPPRVDLTRLETGWNLLTVAVLVGTALDITVNGNVLMSGIHFIVFLGLNKLFNRRQSRDYLQLYVLSFLQMVAATVINADLVYGALFLAYVVFTTWTLILFHLRREMEENFLLKYADDGSEARPVQVQRVLNSRKLVGGRFLGLTSLISLVVFLGAIAVFFAFPRVGFGFFFKKQRAGLTMAGFSEQVELGHFGRIKDDATVVLRVEFPNGGRNDLDPYWRGVAFDHYDGTRWTKSVTAPTCRVYAGRDGRHPLVGTPVVRGERCVFVPAKAPPVGREIEQRIYLEPMNSKVLFGLTALSALRLPGTLMARMGRGPSVRVDPLGDVSYAQFDDLAFRYTAISHAPALAPDALTQPLADYRAALPEDVRARYLQLPDDLSPEIRALAQRLTRDARTVGEAVDAVESHLRSRYGYTLDLGRDPRYPPLDDFLFVQRQGHCEYFATALVILLRASGIAARNVNGFLGGTWNSYGRYLAVSQGDAHSWAEVYLGPQQWQTRDPTPSGPGRGLGTVGLMTRLSQYTDALRLRWYKYIIEYDLQAQVSAVQGLRDALKKRFGGGGGRRPWRAMLQDLLQGLLWAAGLAFALWAARRFRWRRLSHDPARRQAAIADLFERLQARYGRLGFTRRDSETPGEFLARLHAGDAPDVAVADEVWGLYDAVRYGGAPADGAQILALRRAVRDIGRG